ncbi:hypothetical protein GCM10011581_33340 [Saccharopolyspora subtropica]|uniref:Uncharacterized protein n=1 Tax=Saccharopolyspora thermophila TaxID=89367 RepID=A0A917JZ01_9PSEU|nr:hypothetical protein [Saccharopolyspora subtropica]GGI93625.1 hypothetical protein GCM10011581_33340 [Saccharopolyspora subtropica]
MANGRAGSALDLVIFCCVLLSTKKRRGGDGGEKPLLGESGPRSVVVIRPGASRGR